MINALLKHCTSFKSLQRTLAIVCLFVLFVTPSAFSQVTMTTTGSYSQNFDGLISTGSATWTDNTTVANWYAQRTGTGTTVVANDGASNSGALYSYGTTAATERALGTVGSGTPGHFAYGILLQNNSGATITDIKVTYTMEQWRNSAAAAQTVSFYYKTSATTFTALNPNSNGTWTSVAALNATTPITGGTAVALNGNLGTNQVSFSNIAIPSLSLANGSFIMLKWDDPDNSGADHGISIDNVTISWTATPTSTATLANITQPSGSITQGTSDAILSGFTLSADVASDFTSVTVSTTGTATSTDISNVRIFSDLDGNGAINGADAAVSASALAYAASMNFSITGETGITTARNYLIVADIAQSGISTPGRTVTASVGSGAFVTTAAANFGSATGNSRTLSAPNPTKLAITNINPASPFTNTAFSITVQAQDANSIAQVVTANTDVSLTLASGTGNLTGTLSGTILAGTNQIIITGILYDVAESGVSITATRTAGDVLTAITSSTFTVTVNATATIFVSASLTPFATAVGTPSSSQSYSVSGSNLSAGIAIAPPANFEIWDNVGSVWVVFPNSVTIPDVSGVVSPTTVLVRYNPATAGSHSGNVQHTSTGATQVDLGVSGTSIEAEPGTQCAITFGAINGSSIEVNFSGGTGANRIVVASLSPITFIPSDGAAISGTVSSDFALATTQGITPDKVVYDGSGNTVTVTSLAGTTLYYFAVYDYNGTGLTANYYTVSPGAGSATTIATEPSTSSTVSFTRIKETMLYISFTGGNGSNRMVVVNSTPVTFVPADGSTYSGADTAFATAADLGGGDKLVYSGTATSAIITGLTRGTTYNVRVYEFNGTLLNTNYKTVTFGNGNATTPDYISYSTGTYTQDFNGIPATGGLFGTSGFGQGPYYLSTPPMNSTSIGGWQITNQTTNGDIRFETNTGSGNSGSVYSYGANLATERAIGSLGSANNPAIGSVFTNTSGAPLSSVTITFVGEQWRFGGGVPNTLTFEYQVAGTDILNGTFTGVAGLDFTSPVTSGVAGPLDGNIAPNRTAKSYTFTLNSNWLPGQTLVIRWKDFNDSGADDGLAIDDFTFSAVGPQTPLVQDNSISFFSTLTNATGVSWINGDGTNRIVKMNTVNSFTDPVDGNTYAANSVYGGGEQVVFDGPGSTVSVTNLTPSTQYFFRVYGYNGTSVATKYNTTTATDNPKDVTTAAPSFPTQLVVLDVNGGLDVVINQPFSVTIQAQDNFGSPQNVTQNTTIDLTVFSGFGTLLSGVTSGIMTVGTNQITISGIVYDAAEYGVILNAATTAGDILFDGQTPSFNVYDVANQLQFANTPPNGVVNVPINQFYVYATRPDASIDPYYVGSATIALFPGSGAMSGTLTVPFVNGIATFSDIEFNLLGTYVLEATSGILFSTFSSNILINPPIAFTEHVVPQYMGAKTTTGASGTNLNRTPIAVCFQIDNLTPNTSYNVAAGIGVTSDLSTSLGAGSIWNGIAYSGQTRNSAFTTDANGSSGAVWIYLQPSANETRFGGGAVHNVRIAYSTGSFGTNIVPNFITTKTITALDIATSAITPATTDDGAFLTGALSACSGGKHILVFDNTAGTGDPLFSYMSNPSALSQISQTNFPTTVDQIFMGTAAAGTFAAVYPIGANSPNGVKRVEARNEDNTISAFETSATGIWPSGVNTTNAVRREVKDLLNSDVSLSSVTVSASGTNILCFGAATGSATATASSLNSPISYLWSPGGEITNSISSLIAGTYVVTATDGIGCTASSTVIVTEPADIFIVGQVTNTGCVGGDIGAVDITVGGGTSPFTYLWSNSATTEDISGLAAGTYSVTVTDANGCTKSATFNVITQNSNPTITVTATPSTICAGQSSTLEATGATSYTWSPAGSLSSSTDPIVTATPTTTTTYSVVAVDFNGCQSIGTVTLTVNPLPIVGVTPASSNICEGSSVSLSATGALTYAWSPATGLSATTGSPVVATPTTSTDYTVIGTSVDNCTASAIASITVTSVAAPTASSPITYCQNATASALTATALPGNDLWWYTTSTGGNAASAAPIPSTATAGSTTYYVSQQQSNPLSIAINGYIDNSTPDSFAFVSLSKIPAGTVIYFTDNGYATVPVLPATTPGFRGASALNAKGNEDMIKLTAINTIPEGTIIRSYVSTADFAWTFSGPITCSTCTTVSNYAPLAFAAGGDQIYAFTSTTNDNPLFNAAQQTHLYVFDETNGFETATSTATGALPPGIVAGVTANTFASSGFFNLNNDLQTRSVAAWRTYMSLITNYTTGAGTGPGLPTTSLNVDLGCESPRTPITVIVNEAPVVTATSTPILCNGGTSTVTVSATGGTSPYTGEGTFTVSAGTHNYSVSDALGCLGSTSITVTEPALLTATSVETVAILCNGGLASVTVTGSGGTAPYTGEGVFNVPAGTHNFTVTDFNGCTAVTTITISEPTAIVVTATETSAIVCPGGTATITVTATGGTGAYTGEGTFTVLAGTHSYTVTDINGCSGTTSITVSDPAAVGITSFTPSTGCVGSTVSIFGSNLNLVSAIDLNGISAIFVIVNPGEITVTVPPSATSGVFNLYTSANCTTSTVSGFTVTICPTGMTINLTAYLQGYYLGGGTMEPVLANQAIPGATGAETDTIDVEIYDATTFLLAGSVKAVLMTDGTCTAVLNGADGNYYVAIRQRNHVFTWSSVPVAFAAATPTSYDFSTDPAQAFSGDLSDKFSEGIYSLFVGDINQDEFVDGNDYPQFDTDNSLGLCCDYYATDMNGDGFVDGNDYPQFDTNNSLGIGSVHP